MGESSCGVPRCYEVARKHGKSITDMEPIKGGQLASPPGEVRRIFREADPEASFASWAVRYAASLDGIITVLSGMSNVAQMEDNLSCMKDLRPLGISNFEEPQIKEILDACEIVPAFMHVEAHPYFPQTALKAFLKDKGAWHPLGHGDRDLVNEPVFTALAKKYGKTAARSSCGGTPRWAMW